MSLWQKLVYAIFLTQCGTRFGDVWKLPQALLYSARGRNPHSRYKTASGGLPNPRKANASGITAGGVFHRSFSLADPQKKICR